MSQTAVLKGDALARKLYSVALFAQTQRLPGFGRMLTGPSADAGAALAKIKGQSVPDMPIVRVTDLSKTAGDTVSVDMFGVIGGTPITGDQIAEGRGEKLTSSSMDISINLMTKVVDAGGKMSQPRPLQDLRTIAMAQMTNYFARLDDQTSLVHMAGARGFQVQNDWVVPAQSDPAFNDVMVNPVKAPTYNRHFVASGSSIVRGGAQLASIASADVFQLSHIDALRTFLDELEYPLQPVRIADDPAAADDPMWVMFVSPRQYSSLITGAGASGTTLRAFQQNAWQRASYGSKHPLFKGEVGMWNGILVKKMNRSIRFTTGTSTNIINDQLGHPGCVDRQRPDRHRDPGQHQREHHRQLRGRPSDPAGRAGPGQRLREEQVLGLLLLVAGAHVQLRAEHGSRWRLHGRQVEAALQLRRVRRQGAHRSWGNSP